MDQLDKVHKNYLKIGIVSAVAGLMIILILVLRSSTKMSLPIFSPTPTLQEIPTLAIPQRLQVEPTLTEEENKLQIKYDKEFGEWQENVLNNYPWYESLPLQTENYFVYFDLDKKIFIADLYPKESAPESVDTQVTFMKNEIQNRLEVLGIDTALYNFEWNIKPEV